MHLSHFHFSHSGWAVLPILRLCHLYSQHQRLPVVWRQEMHLCFQQLQLCECYRRGRKSSFRPSVQFTIAAHQPLHPFFIKFWSVAYWLNIKMVHWVPSILLFCCRAWRTSPSARWEMSRCAPRMQTARAAHWISTVCGTRICQSATLYLVRQSNSYTKRTTHSHIKNVFFFFFFSFLNNLKLHTIFVG